MAGEFDGKDWVTATGYYHGTFHENWLGLPVAGMPVRLRFGEFCALADGKITEVYLLFDLVDVLQQVGVNLLTSYGGEQGYVPGPLTGDGVLLTEQPADASAASLQLVYDMIYKGLAGYDQQSLASMNMTAYWKPNMLWYGPAGIGTTRGLKGFEDQHQGPFLVSFPDRRGGHHKARFGDGDYVASTGWPSVIGTHVADYLGVPGTGKPFEMRVMDWWRAEDGLLYENWVLLDLPHTFLTVGHDILAGLG
jgi:predicted ester cyclase